jgi:transcriptional regulator with XRE-family HTH domain
MTIEGLSMQEKKIRQIRKLRNFTQEYVTSLSGVSTRAYSKIEREATQLTIKRLNERSAILEASPIEILG